MKRASASPGLRSPTAYSLTCSTMQTLLRRMRTVFALVVVASPPLASADAILDWNQIVLNTVRDGLSSPTTGSRAIAIAQAAMFDAVNAIDRRYLPYSYYGGAPAGASADAAVAKAAHDVLIKLYPGQQAVLNGALDHYLSGIAAGAGKDAGVKLGGQTAQTILSRRQNDGSDRVVNYTPTNQPGHWQPSPPDFRSALSPQWGSVKPFALASGDQFRPGPPPALDSAQYAQSFNQVKELGAKDSASRTAEQTQIGFFWAYDVAGVGPPPILYNQVARTIAEQQGNTLLENARLFALLNIAQADAGIATWEAKYHYDFWRPITAIRDGGLDGNPDTVEDPAWEPLAAPGDGFAADFTPPFPAYVSGHAAFGAATFRVLLDFYGTNDMAFTLTSEEMDGDPRPSVERSFKRFSDAALENALSRIYLGIHWDFDAFAGIELGNNVADWVADRALRPVPVPATSALVLLGVVLLFRVRHSSRTSYSRI